MNWRWKTALVVFGIYMAISRYCAFKLAVGLSTTNCSCG